MGIPFLFLKNTCGEPPLAGVAAGGNVAVTLTRPPKAWSLFPLGVARRLEGPLLMPAEALRLVFKES